jgi:DNA-binding YbaB/EbfC family protein
MTERRAGDGEHIDLAQVAERARQMRQHMERVREDIQRYEARGFGGNGLVQATISGEHVLVALSIDPSVIDPHDPETLQELVREAVNDALARVTDNVGERVAPITSGLQNLLAGVRDRGPGVVPLTASRRPSSRPRDLP